MWLTAENNLHAQFQRFLMQQACQMNQLALPPWQNVRAAPLLLNGYYQLCVHSQVASAAAAELGWPLVVPTPPFAVK